MLYEQYRTKIAKVADALATLRKFRILILCICAFIAVLTATLLGISGTVYDASECPAAIEAGEQLPYRAGAIFNSVGYEYSEKGSNVWMAEMPKRPGDYLVRSFSEDIGGNPRYGKAHSFTVLPRTVIVTADCASAVYGELPPVKAELLYSDTVTCSQFTYSDYSSQTTRIEPVAEAVTVYDENGNDVTYTYNVQTQSSQMDFLKREISVNLSPYTAEYDGKEHPKIPYTGYEISSETPLAEGDFEEVFVRVFRTQAGEYANEIYFKIHKRTEGGSVEVTSNYDIKVSSGTLTVNKRTLEITTADFTAVYDGQEKHENGFTLAESSLSALEDAGHTISVVGNTVQKNAGEYLNELEFTVTDKDGNDVTSNYAFDFTYGTLSILPRPLTCTTYSEEWIYDGTTHSDNTGFVILKNSSSSYASDDEIAYFVEGSEMHVKDVKDSCKNKIQIGVINSVTGEDVTLNYEINYVYGDITVLPRPITVNIDGEEWEYDGEAHSSNKHTITYDEDVIDFALAEGHTVTARGLKTITEVGSVQNGIDFGIYDGKEIVTDNYDIEWCNGDITVIPRKITVGAKSYEKIYDGTPLTSNGVEVVSETKLVKGHYISGDTEGIVVNAETVNSAITDRATIAIVNEDGADVSYNYEIENIVVGTLTVTRRKIKVTAGSAQKVYDGTPLTCKEYSVTSELETPLVSGQLLTATTVGSVTNANSDTNEIATCTIAWGDTDVTPNYDIEYGAGTLTVTKRRATILTASTDENGNKLVYNALPQSLAKFEEIEEDNINAGILKGHTLYIIEAKFVTEVSAEPYENVITLGVKYGEEDVTDNYELTVAYGNIIISPRPITVTTLSKTDFVYDATAKSYLECTIDNLVQGHEWQADKDEAYTQVTDAEEKDNVFAVRIFNGEEDVTYNYEIIYNGECGKIKVNPLPVTVITEGKEFVYNAKPQSYDGHHVSEETPLALASHKTVASELATVTNVLRDGETPVKNTMSISVEDENGTDVTNNYKITVNADGILTVTPRPISVRTASTTWTFDGTYHSDGAVEDTDGKLIDEPPYNHTFAYGGTLPQIKEAGELQNKFDFYIINAQGEDVTYNYALTVEYGILKINALPIKVTANDDEKIYDGDPLVNSGFTVTANGYKSEFDRLTYRFEATVIGQATDVGDEGINEVSDLKVFDGETEVDLKNFEIEYVNGKLTIKPRPVTVTSGSDKKVYDGTALTCNSYTVTSDYSPALVKDHKEQVEITGTITNAGKADNVFNCKILDGNGDDVTANYKINSVKGSLTVTKRPVTITTASNGDDNKLIYNDGKQSFEVFEVEQEDAENNSGILSDHTASIKTVFYAINAGTYKNAHTFEIKAGEKDVTSNYEIKVEAGTLTITKRNITLETGSKELVYDGQEHYLQKDVSISEDSEYPLVNGHELSYGISKILVNVSEVENERTVKILKGGTDVTSNYEINYVNGTIKVTPRPVKVYAVDSEKVYDGTSDTDGYKKFDAIFGGEEENFALVAGHTISADITDIEADAGEYPIAVKGTASDVYIYNGYSDVTSNYEITVLYSIPSSGETAIFTVTSRTLTVTTGSAQREYNGTPLTKTDDYKIEGLVAGHEATLTITVSQTDAGSSDNTFNEESLTVTSGEEDVTRNYKIITEECSLGILTVTARPIYVTTADGEKVYDGDPLTNGDYTAENLAAGHTAIITVIGSQTKVGESYNTIEDEFTVVDAEGNVINKDNYYIDALNLHYGTLKVTGKLTIATAGGEKEYDGTPLTNDNYEIISSAVPEDYTVIITVTGTQTDVGASDNTFKVQVLDENGGDVTVYFDISSDMGTLTVYPRPITITSGSASKMYDGTPLTYDVWEITEGSLAEGHTASVYVFGEIIEVGTELNEFEIEIFDENGFSVVRNYYITRDCGFLTISENTENPDNNTVFIKVKPDVNGDVYLKQQSFGDYLGGMSWTNPAQYGETINFGGAEYGYGYLTSFALGNSGNGGKVEIELTNLPNAYLLPYYAKTDGGHTVQTSDTVYTGNTLTYSVNYFNYDYLASGKPNAVTPYPEQEARYSEFVKQNYLSVDGKTRDFLEDIIRENNLSKDDIAGVVKYIKGIAAYDLKQDYSALESNENVIISFIRDSEYGVCRHFAMAGTMLFRVLGIPARYTIGFARNLQAGVWTEFTTGHGWVEIYVDGLGWVMLEVTPSASMSEGGGENGGGQHTYSVTLKPKDAVKTYDGTELTATELEPDLTLVRLSDLGYTYEVVFDGSQTEVGESISNVISFTIFTPDGAVFEDVDYTFEKGLLKVVDEAVVTIHTYSKQKVYDGAPMYFKSNEYYASFPTGFAGYRAEVTGLDKVGLTGAGILKADRLKAQITVKIYDADGNDATQLFYIDYDVDYMITQCAVTIATNNVSKEYDGEELIDDGEPKLIFGSLISGHGIKVTSRPSITEVGEEVNRMEYQIVDKNGVDVSNNYAITKIYGNLTITEGD